MSAAVGSANVTQWTKVQLISTTIPSNAIGVLINGQVGSYPQGGESIMVAASFTAYLEVATNTLTSIYGTFADVNYDFGSPQTILSLGGIGDLLPTVLTHKVYIENYGGAGGALDIYSEDASWPSTLPVETAAINVMVEFITS